MLASHEEIPDAGNNPRTICVFIFYADRRWVGDASEFSMNLFELCSSNQLWTGLTPWSAREPQADFYRICGTEQ